MRKVFIGAACGSFLAFVMGATGHNFDTWQFWAALTAMLVYGTNMAID